MVPKTDKEKKQERPHHPQAVFACRSELSEELPDSETPFWSSALDSARDLPSALCSIPSAKELIVLQESQLPLLEFPLVPTVAPSVCRSHASMILLVLQLSVSSSSRAAFSCFGARALGLLA